MSDTDEFDKDPERNRFSARVGRTVKVGTNLSGAGLTFAANAMFGGEKGDEDRKSVV